MSNTNSNNNKRGSAIGFDRRSVEIPPITTSHSPIVPTNSGIPMWTLIVKAKAITLRTKVCTNWTISYALDQLRKKVLKSSFKTSL